MAVLSNFLLLISLLLNPKGDCDRGAACTCIGYAGQPPPVEEIVQHAFESSDAVFLGRVVAGRVVKNERPPSPDYYELPEYAEFTFSVAEQWKGVEASTIKIRTGLGGGDCGYAFKLGYSYLVYARSIIDYHDEQYLATGICDRTPRAGNQDVRILRRITGN